MPQFGVLVYSPAPADPGDFSPEELESLERYPAQVQELGAKVLGGSYFPSHRGFAFHASTSAKAVRGDLVSEGPLVESDLVPAAFYVMSAKDMDVAVEAARLHPAVREGGVEVRPLFSPPSK